MPRLLTFVLTALAALAVAAPVAHAGREFAFDSPSGKINCTIGTEFGKYGVACTTNENATASGSTKWIVLSNGTARAKTKKSMIFQGEFDFTLKYGKTLYINGGSPKYVGTSRQLRCTMRKSGITCKNRRHGFRLAVGVRKAW